MYKVCITIHTCQGVICAAIASLAPRIFPERLCHKPLGITECCASLHAARQRRPRIPGWSGRCSRCRRCTGRRGRSSAGCFKNHPPKRESDRRRFSLDHIKNKTTYLGHYRVAEQHGVVHRLRLHREPVHGAALCVPRRDAVGDGEHRVESCDDACLEGHLGADAGFHCTP